MSGHPSNLLTRRTLLRSAGTGAVTQFAGRHNRAREAAVERVANGELQVQAEIPLEPSLYDPLIDVRAE